jgi:hypothetical protein
MKGKFLLLTVAPLAFATCQAHSSSEKTLRPGQDIAEIVATAEPGTTFNLEPGEYRLQRVRPKDGQSFVGKGRVVFNGSMLLENWQRAGARWVADGPKDRLRPHGPCDKTGSNPVLCSYREDLFLDGVLYRRVGSLGELASGKWYDDGAKIRVLDNPTGKKAELSVVPFAFYGEAQDVVLQNIIVEKYASAAQQGAIEFRKAVGWKLINVSARWNHGVGARIGSRTHIAGGAFSHNGQLGIGGNGTDSVIENVEIAHNNYAGFSAGWEAGGTKFVRADGLVVRNACVHSNDGPGLWTDIDNINIEYVDNMVFNNAGDGIKHEISYSARIHGNTVAQNGKGKHNWLWGSQILVQNSGNVEVFDNIVEVAADFGNGISVINQDRGEGAHGPWISNNVRVYRNEIIHLGANGKNGMIADHDKEWFYHDSGNLFHSNTYVVPDPAWKYVVVRNRSKTFEDLPNFGMELDAKVISVRRKQLDLQCK